jgi:hypothetical protein
MAVTAFDIVVQALKKAGVLGVGQTPLAEDTNDAFYDLNDMIAQWARKRWLMWHLLDISLVSTGAMSYTVGIGGDFNTPRPDRLEAAFFRQIVPSQPNQIDYPLELIESREAYNNIALKSLKTFPTSIFYDAAYPIGTIYPWPVPQATIYEIHLTVKDTLAQFATLTQVINMPPEFVAAMKFNLAIRLKQSYQLPVDIALVALAKDSLAVIRSANTQIPTLNMPSDLIRGGLNYNVFSDQYS